MIDGLSVEDERFLLLNSHQYFTTALIYDKHDFYINSPFDKIFGHTIDRVFNGEIKRLIINIPVGMGKTDRGVISVIARGLAMNPKARFLHISYDKTLALENSSQAKDFIESEYFQEFFDVRVKKGTSAKGLWKTEAGGIVKAVSSGGGITGSRAGIMGSEKFAGALLIDDPIKIDDINSVKKMEFINSRYESTFKSRLADENVPVIVIMQRVHKNDFTNHLLTRYPNEWHQLVIPALLEKENYCHENAIPIDIDLPLGALWESKISKEDLLKEKLINPTYFYSQLNQEPSNTSDSPILKGEWIRTYDELPVRDISRVVIYADIANKVEDRHDFTVFIAVGEVRKNGFTYIYILDMLREKLEFQNLVPVAKRFFERWTIDKPIRGIPSCSTFQIEDKANGTPLIQTLRSEGINVIAKQRNRNKVERALNASYLFSYGLLLFPNVHYLHDAKKEFDEFSDDDSHKSDDIIDCCLDAVESNLPKGKLKPTFHQLPI